MNPTQQATPSTYMAQQPPILQQPVQMGLPVDQNQNMIQMSQSQVPQNQTNHMENLDPKRHRRSKHEQEGRIYRCECGKAYLSQPALNNHKKSKHPELNVNGEKRGRGRPRKYLPNYPGDFETNKYENFFSSSAQRKKEDDKPVNIENVVNTVFEALYNGAYKDKMFNQPKTLEDNYLLKSLKDNAELSTKEKKDKSCDEVLYEYLHITKDKCNESYFILVLKFILLFRECFNITKSQGNEKPAAEGEYKKEPSSDTSPETLPELCNEFYTNFMENNNFFGIDSEQEKNEIIEIIQHFCIWLFKSDYTKSKLSLAQ